MSQFSALDFMRSEPLMGQPMMMAPSSVPMFAAQHWMGADQPTTAVVQPAVPVQQVVKRPRSASVNKDEAGPKRRQTRPKVVEEKGGVQCVGVNRKKGTQCRNAALMEYVGPRPQYCAEHIELDPNSLYEKCKSTYQKEPNDGKPCKEVVLKEFHFCYKHFPDLLKDVVARRDLRQAEGYLARIVLMLEQLSQQAAAAKKKDGDLYQRKNKLIPKFQQMSASTQRAIRAMKEASMPMRPVGSPMSSPAPGMFLPLQNTRPTAAQLLMTSSLSAPAHSAPASVIASGRSSPLLPLPESPLDSDSFASSPLVEPLMVTGLPVLTPSPFSPFTDADTPLSAEFDPEDFSSPFLDLGFTVTPESMTPVVPVEFA